MRTPSAQRCVDANNSYSTSAFVDGESYECTIDRIPKFADPWRFRRRRPDSVLVSDLWMHPQVLPLYSQGGRWRASFGAPDHAAGSGSAIDADSVRRRIDVLSIAISESGFTPSQLETFRRVMRGLSEAEVAREKGVSRSAVSQQIAAMCASWEPFGIYRRDDSAARATSWVPNRPVPADFLFAWEADESEGHHVGRGERP